MILKLEKINFTTISPILLKDVHIEKVFVSKKNSSGEKNYKYFIGYLHDDYKVKPLHIMLSKASPYVKSYDGKTKWAYSLIKDEDLLKNIILFEIKSVLI